MKLNGEYASELTSIRMRCRPASQNTSLLCGEQRPGCNRLQSTLAATVFRNLYQHWIDLIQMTVFEIQQSDKMLRKSMTKSNQRPTQSVIWLPVQGCKMGDI